MKYYTLTESLFGSHGFGSYSFHQSMTVLLSCYCSVPRSCPSLCDPMDYSMPGFPVLHYLLSLHKLIHWVGDAGEHHLMSCCLLLLPSVFPSITVFSKESALCIRWPKYWSFSFRSSPSNEYPGLISFKMYWFDLLAVQGTLKSPL